MALFVDRKVAFVVRLLLAPIACVASCAEEPTDAPCQVAEPASSTATTADICSLCKSGAGICKTTPQVVGTAWRTWDPSIDWSGDKFGVAWTALPEPGGDARVDFTTIATDGRALTPPRTVSPGRGESAPRLAWDGKQFDAVWTWFDWDKGQGLRFAAVDRDGTSGPEIGVAPGAFSQDIPRARAVAANSKVGVLWASGAKELTFVRLDRSGKAVLGPVALKFGVDDVPQDNVALAWNGENYVYAAGWFDSLESGDWSLELAELSADGTPIRSLVVDDSPNRTNARSFWIYGLVWTGNDYGLLWTEGNDSNAGLYLARIDATLQEVLNIELLTTDYTSDGSALAWTGEHFVVSWPSWPKDPEATPNARQDVQLAYYSHELEKVAGPVQLSASNGGSRGAGTGSTTPDLVVVGDAVAVVWRSDGEEGVTCGSNDDLVMFTRVALCR